MLLFYISILLKDALVRSSMIAMLVKATVLKRITTPHEAFPSTAEIMMMFNPISKAKEQNCPKKVMAFL